jgi:excisionase family DNA binding protein
MKTSYTTTEAAKLCGISPNMVLCAFDRGDLLGFRIPGSKHRRIPAANLRHWMERHHIPMPTEATEPSPIGR